MNGFSNMLKLNLKLLLRNKGYLGLLLFTPLIAVLLLNLSNGKTWADTDANYKNKIIELGENESTAMNMTGNTMSIKIYDSSQSPLSEFIIQNLAESGAYTIYRYKSEKSTVEEIYQKASAYANKNNISAVLYLADTMEMSMVASVHSNNATLLADSVSIFPAGTDERIALLNEDLSALLNSLAAYSAISGNDSGKLGQILDELEKNKVKKDIQTLAIGDKLELNEEQQSMSTSIGLSLAVITIGFLFTGIFIANIVVEERDNRVFKRISLTNISSYGYGSVKIILSLLTVFLQTLVTGTGILLFVKTDFGISLGSYLLFVFGLGIVFNFISVIAGVIINNTISASYMAFCIWFITNMFAGLYFPLDGASEIWGEIALFMPQHWVVKSSEMLMAGQSGAYSTFFLVMAGISDDGIGANGITEGMGLSGMKQRVRKIGGTLDITSYNGFSIQMILPFED